MYSFQTSDLAKVKVEQGELEGRSYSQMFLRVYELGVVDDAYHVFVDNNHIVHTCRIIRTDDAVNIAMDSNVNVLPSGTDFLAAKSSYSLDKAQYRH
jgi:hypothetical protein